MRPIAQKALRSGCARIGMEDVLRTQFGMAKHTSTLEKCRVAERACTLCFGRRRVGKTTLSNQLYKEKNNLLCRDRIYRKGKFGQMAEE